MRLYTDFDNTRKVSLNPRKLITRKNMNPQFFHFEGVFHTTHDPIVITKTPFLYEILTLCLIS